MKKVLFYLLCCIFSAVTASEISDSISESKWIEPQGNSQKQAFFRSKFIVDRPVKRASYRTFLESRNLEGKCYVNGREVFLRPCREVEKFRGHVRAQEIDFSALLKTGENVIAFELQHNGRYMAMILRGNVEFTDGTKFSLASTAKQFRASEKAVSGWNEPGFDDSGWLPVHEMGDVRLSPWSRYGDIPRIYCTPAEYEAYRISCNNGFSETKLAAEPENPVVKVVYRNQIPGIDFNGTIFPPHILSSIEFVSSQSRDAMLMEAAKAGLQFVVIGVNDQTCASGIGAYDFTELDLGIRRLLAIHPDAKIIFSYRGMPLGKWLDQNPDECVGYAVKREKYSWEYWGNPKAESFASRKYRSEVVDQFVHALGKFCADQPWGRRVIAVQLQYGGSGDGMPWGCHDMPDTGKRMTEAFRRFLHEKYSSDATLQKSWSDPSATRASASVPDSVQRWGSKNYLRDPGDPRDRRMIDYYECYHREFSEFMIDFGKSVKKAFPGRLAGTFYGYTILGYPPEGNTANMEPVLKSPYIDYMGATTLGYNLTDGLHRTIASFFQRYGKYTSIEADIRVHNGAGQAENQWLCKTPEESRATIEKVIGNSFFNGCGYHTVDFGQNTKWFNCPEMLEPIAKGIKLWKKLFNAPPQKTADIAVILDPNQVWRQGPPDYWTIQPFANALVPFALTTLNFSGFAHDLMSLDDYLESDRNYRAVVFLNLFEIAPEKQTALLKKIRSPGVTAIWNYAPGLLSSNGYSEKAMHELTGLSLKIRRNPGAFTAEVADGKAMEIFEKRNYTSSPRIHADEPSAEILAKYTDDKSSAMIRRKLSDGSIAVFSGIPVNSAVLWAKLLKQAGCHAYTPPGFYVRRNSVMLQIFSAKGGTIPPEGELLAKEIDQTGIVSVTLEKPAKQVTDLFTDEKIAENTAHFELKSQQPHLWLLEIR